MLHAYRLVSPFSQHAPAQLWEYAQPSIHHLILNARTFDRWVVGWPFPDWHAMVEDHTRIWETYYWPKPLYDAWPTWEDWLPEYRRLIIEVQEIWEKRRGNGLVVKRG